MKDKIAKLTICSVLLLTACSNYSGEHEHNANELSSIELGTKEKDTVSENKDDISITGIRVPKGTQILPESENTEISNELSNYELISVELSECKISGEFDPDLHHSIEDIVHSDTLFMVNFNFAATCGSDFLCEVKFLNDDTLNLIYHQYNSYASCHCCYGLKYQFRIVEVPPSFKKVRIKYLMFNGEDRKAI